jgi:hypothetical protein
LQAVNPLPMMLQELFCLAFNHGTLSAAADRNPSLGETMNRLRQLCAVTVLTILLTTVASADEGVIHPQYAPPPPPATAEVVCLNVTATGEAGARCEEPTIDLATEITLALIQNILVLF